MRVFTRAPPLTPARGEKGSTVKMKAVLLLAVSAGLGCDRVQALWAKPPPPPVASAPTPAPTPPPPPPDPLAAAGLEKVSFEVDGPLEESLRRVTARETAPALAQVTARLLVWWVDVARGLRKGDVLTVLFQRIPNKEPLVHALKFHSGKNERDYQAYLYKPEGSRFSRYYDAAGEEVEERIENSPLDDYEQVTSILRDGRRHRGVDFKTPTGTPVKAPFDLVITRKNWNFRGNGNCLEMQNGAGQRVVFLHLAELPRALAVGQRFKMGQVIAESGNTGHTTAPHLHYQLETPDGRLLDPFKVHKTYHRRLDEGQLAGFQAAKAKYDAMFAFAPPGTAAQALAPAPLKDAEKAPEPAQLMAAPPAPPIPAELGPASAAEQ